MAPILTALAPPRDGRVGVRYEHVFKATGSLTPSFTVTSGSLPPGLWLRPEGVLAGIPTAPGTFTFSISVSNGYSPDAISPTHTITIISPQLTHDFNNDGNPDVLSRDGDGALWLYPGNGIGGWQARVQVGQGWNVMTSVVAPGDFNGDGNSDLLAPRLQRKSLAVSRKR